MSDAVNTAARLASVAAAGDILATTDAARAAGLDPDLERTRLERTRLELKGKQLVTEVATLRVGPATPA